MRNFKTGINMAITLALILASIVPAVGQKLEISPFLGYETGANIKTDQGKLHVGGGLNFGGSINFSFSGRGSWIEFSYNHMGGSFLSLEDSISTKTLCDLTVDYFSIGGLQEFYSGGTVVPYALFSMGMVSYRPTSVDFSTETRMHLSLAGGAKIYATNRLGFKLQARLLMPLFYTGGYFETSSGGSGYGITTTLAALQGDFTAGLFFVIK